MDILHSEMAKRRSALIDRSKRNPLIHLSPSAKSKSHIRFVAGGIDGIRRKLATGLVLQPSSPVSLVPSTWTQDLVIPNSGQVVETQARPAYKVHTYELTHGPDGVDPATDLDGAELEKRLSALARKSKTQQAETGLNPLNVAFGTMRWREDERARTVFESPIVICPVAVAREIEGHRYRTTITSADEEVEVNPALRNRLRELRGIDLPDIGDEESVGVYLQRIAELLAVDLIEVIPTATIATLPASRMAMWRDLDPTNWPEGLLENHSLVPVLLSAAPMEGAPTFSGERDVDAIAEKAPGTLPRIIYDADASQISVLLDIRESQSRSIAVEGPPGTGKSQTIANIIADALDRGLRVLFVAEKQAALDVVSARLKNRGMGPLLFEMHSDTGTKAGVISQIKSRLRYDLRSATSPVRRREEIEGLHGLLRRRADAPGARVATGMDLNDVIWRAVRIKARLSEDMVGHAMTMADPAIELHLLDEVAQVIQSWLLHQSNVPEVDPWIGLELDIHHERDTIAAAARMLLQNIEKLRSIRTPLTTDAVRATFDDVDNWRHLAEIDTPRFTSSGLEIAEARTKAAHHRQVIALDRSIQDARSACDDIHPSLSRIGVAEISSLIDKLEPHGVTTIADARTKLINLRRRQDEMQDRIRLLEPLRRIAGSDRPDDLQRAYDMLGHVGDHVLDAEALELSRIAGVDRGLEKLEKDIQALRIRRDRMDAMFRPGAQDEDSVEDDMAVVREARAMHKISGRYAKSLNRLKGLLAAPPSDAAEILHVYGEAERAFYDVQRFEDDRPGFLPEVHWKGLDTDVSALVVRISGERAIRSLLAEANLPSELADDAAAARLLHRDEALGAALRNASLACHPLASLAGVERTMAAECADLEKLIEDNAHLPKDLKADVQSLGATRDLATLVERLGWLEEANPATSRRLLDDVQRLDALPLVEPFVSGVAVADDVEGYLRAVRDTVALLDKPFDAVVRSLRLLCGHLRIDASVLVNLDRPDWDGLAERVRQMASDEASGAFTRNIELTTLRDLMIRHQAFAVLETLPEGIRPDQIGDFLRLATYAWRIRAATRGDASIILEKGEIFADRARRYRELDAELQQMEADRIVAERVSGTKVPEGVSHGVVGDFTERALLEREVDKIKRHIPVRQLVRRAGRAMQELMPVWLMSPASVAQSVPPASVWFDLVIIDEASQMRPENAIGSLLRGHQAVIVGDRNQMPPSRQFEVQDEEVDDDKATIADEAESILDLANARLSHKRRLRWHYRSRHPDLIAFSNARYYQDDLVVMPAPRKAHGLLGVHSHYVRNARYANGLNLDEGKVVIETTCRFMAEHPDATLAVVAINANQAEWISIRLDEIALENVDVRSYIERHREGPEPFIVRNLENIQGDERDVIIISTVYGPNAVGRASAVLSSPLNRSDGHRRLNVLVSRARSAIHLVTSMLPGEIGRSGPGHRGIDDLKAYLTYARTRELSHARQSAKGPDSEFEIHVAERLKDAGFTVDYQIGVHNYWIDLGVSHPDWPYGYIAGVECDGAAWHRGLAVRDRDAIRQGVLERMGWRIIRCWSTDWYGDHRREGHRLVDLLNERLRQLLAEEPPLVAEVDTVEPDVDDENEGREYGGPVDSVSLQMEDRIEAPDVNGDLPEAIEDDEGAASIIPDAPAEMAPVTSIREYAKRFGIDVPEQHRDPDADGPEDDVESVGDEPKTALHPDPTWRACDLDGTAFYEATRNLEYVVWHEDRGEIGRVTKLQSRVVNGRGISEYVAVLKDEREYHTKDLYVAIRWIRRQA